MKKISIFEPPLSNATGGCGVIINPELLRISGIISAFKGKGIIIERYNYVIDSEKFEENSIVQNFIKENGIGKLPITLLENEIVKTGGYPRKDEILKWLGVSEEF